MWDYTRAAKTLLPVVLVGFAVLLWLYFGRTPEPVFQNVPGPTQFVPVPVKVKGKEVIVPGPERIKLVPVEVVKKELKWPDLPADNVIAAGTVPAHRGPTNVATVVSTDNSGVMTATMVMKQMPPPFFELKKEVRLGAYYGNGAVFSPEIAFRPLRVGPVDIVLKGTGIYGSGVNDTRAFIGVEVQFGF